MEFAMADFESLGPGQVGRWVYQVIGKNGPVPNPQNIRYLQSDPTAEAATGVQATALGSSGLTLMASVGSLAVAATTLHEVRKVREQLTGLIEWSKQLDARIDAIHTRLKRVDLAVAENNLRHALRHAISRSIREGCRSRTDRN
jgi:hypothetical protein